MGLQLDRWHSCCMELVSNDLAILRQSPWVGNSSKTSTQNDTHDFHLFIFKGLYFYEKLFTITNYPSKKSLKLLFLIYLKQPHMLIQRTRFIKNEQYNVSHSAWTHLTLSYL